MAALPERCTTRSTGLGESIVGTASMVHRWLLIEHAGPWSVTALAADRLPSGLGAELARRATQHQVRIVLIRRHGRSEPGQAPACFVASTRRRGSWLGQISLGSLTDVLDINLAAWPDGPPAGTRLLDEPLFCVCTHGRHDPCCAERGRPVAAALAARFPGPTWEVSHIGGDRFAGNLVCLPDGDYLGRLAGADAAEIAQRYRDGSYSLPHLRGRSFHPPPVQAAEILVRQRLGVERRDAVRVGSARRDADRVVVRLDVDGHGPLAATVRVTRSHPARWLTCQAGDALEPPDYQLLTVDPAND